MHYYKLTFRCDNAKEKNGFVKCDFPNTPENLMNMLSIDGFDMPLHEMAERFTGMKEITKLQAEKQFSASQNMVRRRTGKGDFYSKPEGEAKIAVVLSGSEEKAILMDVPSSAVNDDCDGEAVIRLMSDAASYMEKSLKWKDIAKADKAMLEKHGVDAEDADVFLVLRLDSDRDIAMQETLSEEIAIRKEDAEKIRAWFIGTAKQNVGETFVKTVQFNDGMQMEISCMPGKQDDDPSYAEMRMLYPSGEEVPKGPSGISDDFFGPWETDFNGTYYICEAIPEDGICMDVARIRLEKEQKRQQAVDDAMAKGISPEPSEEELFQKEAYRLYQLDWMMSMGYSVKDLATSIADYIKESQQADIDAGDEPSLPDPEQAFLDWESDDAFGGSCYVCFDEFLGAEYLDEDYMRGILTPNGFEMWKSFNG